MVYICPQSFNKRRSLFAGSEGHPSAPTLPGKEEGGREGLETARQDRGGGYDRWLDEGNQFFNDQLDADGGRTRNLDFFGNILIIISINTVIIVIR